MSRTSRRASRRLIIVVSVALVLGVVFTIHKLKNSHAGDTKANVASTPAVEAPASVVEPAPTVAPKAVASVKPVAPTTAPSKASTPVSSEFDGLVTQTPTSAVSNSNNSSGGSFSSPTTQPGVSELAAGAQARADAPDVSKSRSTGDFASPIAETAARDVSSFSSPKPNPSIQDARAKADSGDLLASRQLLNDALNTGKLSEADTDATKRQIDEINKTVIFSAKKFPEDPWGGLYQVASGERMATIAARNGVSWDFLSRVNGVTPKKMRSGQSLKIFKGPFYAVVYKHLFKMEIYLGAPGGAGSMYVTSFPVGLGKDNSTPTGLWSCKAGDKIRNPRYYPPRGGDIIAPDDPKNPLGGYWIAIEGMDGQAVGKESYGIHGTIDPNSIGKTESMGCIRLKADDISWVFDLLVDGKSKVLVKD
ncbi:MAG TPA: L,D-transpeptidase family protein [Tepidisphaeraceae bacterium]